MMRNSDRQRWLAASWRLSSASRQSRCSTLNAVDSVCDPRRQPLARTSSWFLEIVEISASFLLGIQRYVTGPNFHCEYIYTAGIYICNLRNPIAASGNFLLCCLALTVCLLLLWAQPLLHAVFYLIDLPICSHFRHIVGE